MGQDSKIEWTTHTFNPWRGCSKVSEGCRFCYAETLSHRNPSQLGIWGDDGTRVVASDDMWRQPLKWNRDAGDTRPRVFCASLADVLERRLDLIEPRRRLFELINATPNLDWLLLTKRPENAREVLPDRWLDIRWPKNVWLGVSVENQAAADERIPILLQIPAAVRFLSCEPLLGPVDISARGMGLQCESCVDRSVHWCVDPVIHWVIAGGESGHHARPCHPDWIRSLRDQCTAAGVPFFFKQWGEFAPSPDGGLPDRLPDSAGFYFDEPHAPHKVWKFGKKAAGRTLDGRLWSEFPSPK